MLYLGAADGESTFPQSCTLDPDAVVSQAPILTFVKLNYVFYFCTLSNSIEGDLVQL